MSSNKSGRVLVAATLVAALFLAVPVEAIDGRGAPLGPLERLAAWFVETWMSDGLAGGTDPATRTDEPASPTEEDEDPEGCRGDYTGCVDPNG
jgi:hypothetical protein